VILRQQNPAHGLRAGLVHAWYNHNRSFTVDATARRGDRPPTARYIVDFTHYSCRCHRILPRLAGWPQRPRRRPMHLSPVHRFTAATLEWTHGRRSRRARRGRKWWENAMRPEVYKRSSTRPLTARWKVSAILQVGQARTVGRTETGSWNNPRIRSPAASLSRLRAPLVACWSSLSASLFSCDIRCAAHSNARRTLFYTELPKMLPPSVMSFYSTSCWDAV